MSRASAPMCPAAATTSAIWRDTSKYRRPTRASRSNGDSCVEIDLGDMENGFKEIPE